MRLSILPILLLTACSNVPVTHPDLPGKIAVEIVCSQLPTTEAKARLERAWKKCYVGPELQEMTLMVGKVPLTVPVGSTGTTQVINEGADDKGTLSVLLPNGKRVLYAQFSSSKNCPSLIAIDSGPALWILAAKNTGTWLQDPNAPGPFSNCK
ncbi:hypothetical protein [Undibacterium rugosum]|uniref:Uncharacterized protein n=1 Tax=Undibacterium rugosum TaxID=2762291 RepID=A0A923KVC9_9BURK|nr:hypothetical protein [Undibacterium rugosum]MBC3935212.1 hypothetical protein [Undibacterium rugosum]MBR7777806.1 hypothetical protein [Undibacterium rugosum]